MGIGTGSPTDYDPNAAAKKRYGVGQGLGSTQHSGLPASSPTSSSAPSSMSGGSSGSRWGGGGSGSTYAGRYNSGGLPTPGQPSAPAPSGPTPGGYAPPVQSQPRGGGSTDELSQRGSDMFDPESEYMKMMRESLTGQVGQETEAQRRLAGFDAAQSGMGAGGSPELMAMLGDIGVGGEEALGQSMGDMMMRAPELGAGMLSSAQQGELGYAGMDLNELLSGRNEAFNKWRTELQQRESQQQREMDSWYRGQDIDLSRDRMNQEAEWNNWSMM